MHMKFIELSGKTLFRILNSDEATVDDLEKIGVHNDSLVRVNLQGDIELRRAHRWDVIGGLLSDFETRLKRETGLDWA